MMESLGTRPVGAPDAGFWVSRWGAVAADERKRQRPDPDEDDVADSA